MKVRPENTKSFAEYKLASFDCFGTLIDWNGKYLPSIAMYIKKTKRSPDGVYKALQPIRSQLPASHKLASDRRALLSYFSSYEVPLVMNNPSELYSVLLEKAYIQTATSLSLPEPSQYEAAAFSGSIGTWPPFADTIAALNLLKRHYKLVILSNVDRASFAKVLAGGLSGITFDAVYTAEDIGSYKPDIKNIDYLLSHAEKDFGMKKEDIIHIAQSLRADHAPAKIRGLDSAWIVRGDEGFAMGGEWDDYVGKHEFTWKYDTMEEIAADVERDFNESA